MCDKQKLERARQQTQQVYQDQATAFDAARSRVLFEKAWLDRLTAGLVPGSRILDLGCGSGAPVAGYLIDRGFALTGLDYAPAMVALARDRFPAHHWMVGDIRDLNLDTSFDAILSWNGFFHLTMAEQRTALPRIVQLLEPGGRLLLTIGHHAGEVTGTVAGETVYHASLDGSEYERILSTARCRLIEIRFQDPDCGGHSILLAQKAG